MALDWLAGILGTAHTPELEAAVEKELGKHFVARKDFNDLNDKYKTATAQAAQLETLRTEKATSDTELQKVRQQLTQQQLDAQISLALSEANVVNRKAVTALLDMTQVKLDDKGQLTGLDTQLTNLKKSDPWAFKAAGQAASQGQLPLGGTSSSGAGAPDGTTTGNADAFINSLMRGKHNAE